MLLLFKVQHYYLSNKNIKAKPYVSFYNGFKWKCSFLQSGAFKTDIKLVLLKCIHEECTWEVGRGWGSGFREQGKRFISFWLHFITGFCKRLRKPVLCCWPFLCAQLHTVILCPLQMVTIYLHSTFLKRLCHSNSLALQERLRRHSVSYVIVNNLRITWKQSFQLLIKDPLFPAPWYDPADTLYYINHIQTSQQAKSYILLSKLG